MATLSIGDYGIIGNYSSCALVNRLGAIDWCCLPYLDSPSHFGALLDQAAGGKFQLSPQGDVRSEQRYLQRSLVLETLFETPYGRAVLTDWMPMHARGASEPILYRRIDMIEGKIGWVLTCDPRFDYGETPTEVEFREAPVQEDSDKKASTWSRKHLLFRGTAAGQIAQLFSSLDLSYSSFTVASHASKQPPEAKFTLTAGQSAVFAWAWGRRIEAPELPPSAPQAGSSDGSLQETVEAWRKIAHRCVTSGCLFAGPWHDATVRSALFLRLLIARYSGLIAEAATTSLTQYETANAAQYPGGDYRYTWIRNSTLALQALAAIGMRNEAKNNFGWLSEIVIRDGVELLQPVYTMDGGKVPAERAIKNLRGYPGSNGVRVGNDEASQFHLDIYGHILLAADFFHREWGELPEGLWPKLREIADFVCGAWRRPDHGPWDDREKPEHYVISKALCWATLDRARAIAHRLGEAESPRWSEEMKILHRTICAQGFDSTANSFVRSFGDTEVDSSALLLPLIGFLPLEDPRMTGTVDAILSRLSEGVLLMRRPSDRPHLWSSFLLIMTLAMSGQVDDASDRMAELCSFATHLGFFGEQVDASTQETLGNFPSASAHLALINAALYIGAARERALPLKQLLGMPERPKFRARNIA